MPSEALPNRPYITLAEAASWLSDYKPLDRDRLRGLRKWPLLAGKQSKEQLLAKWWSGEALPPYRSTRAVQMRARVERAAQKILDAARRGDLTVWGVSAASSQHCRVPEGYLASEIIADPITDHLVPNITKTFDEMPVYKHIRFARHELERAFGGASRETPPAAKRQVDDQPPFPKAVTAVPPPAATVTKSNNQEQRKDHRSNPRAKYMEHAPIWLDQEIGKDKSGFLSRGNDVLFDAFRRQAKGPITEGGFGLCDADFPRSGRSTRFEQLAKVRKNMIRGGNA